MGPDKFISKLKSAEHPVVVDFWASWCGPCQMVRPVLMSLKQEFRGKVEVMEINADDEPELMRKYNVMSIPTLIVFRKDQETERYVGARPAGFYEHVFQQLAEDGILPHDPPSILLRLLMIVVGLVMLLYGLDAKLYIIMSAGGLLLLFSMIDPLMVWKRISAKLRKREKPAQDKEQK